MSVAIISLPPGPNGHKVGVDDFLLTHSVAELEALATAPPPKPAPATPLVELLDEAPATLSRPLALVDGAAYAATWLYVREKTVESFDQKKQRIVVHDPPLVVRSRRLFIVRGDGMISGDGAQKPITDLELILKLDDSFPDVKLWSTRGVKAYAAGARPDPADVFRRVARVFDHYLSFDRSLADQATMAELSSCFSLATWFAGAFDVLGYPWPNGDFGSGKTKWGHCRALTSYLGEVVTWGGTFPSLRDLADAGAAILFDDAEKIDDPKTDPDKRALLLAGNRRGATIPVKELVGDRWVIRRVNAFCPRGFTATTLPAGALRQRIVPIPLVRTDDKKRANRDPAKTKSWPVDYGKLTEDLWAVALALLPEAEEVWSEFDHEEDAIGRELEPWRALLTVARLCERHGVAGLETRIRGMMASSRRDRADDAAGRTWTASVVRALAAEIAVRPPDTWTLVDSLDTSTGEWALTSTTIAERIKAELTDDEDQAAVAWATPDRVGHIMRTLRCRKDRLKDKNRTRVWRLSQAEVTSLVRAYGLIDPDTSRTEIDAREESRIQVSEASSSVQVSTESPTTDDVGDADTEVWEI